MNYLLSHERQLWVSHLILSCNIFPPNGSDKKLKHLCEIIKPQLLSSVCGYLLTQCSEQYQKKKDTTGSK